VGEVLQSACLCVPLSLCLSLSPLAYIENHVYKFYKMFNTCYSYTFDGGSILLWRQCNMLCASGFVDDVMSSNNGVNGPELRTSLFCRVRQMTALAAKLLSTIADLRAVAGLRPTSAVGQVLAFLAVSLSLTSLFIDERSGVESYPYPVKEGQRYINLNPGRLFVQQPPKKGKGSRGSF